MATLRRPAIGERPIVLTIGTSEPLVSAGLLLDLFIADRLEVRPVSVLTAVSAQNGLGQFAIQAISADLVREQLESLREIPIAAIRIGAIPGIEQIAEVAHFLRARALPTIIDPVYATSAGGQLVDEEAYVSMSTLLFPQAMLITPNLHEAELLAGHSVSTLAEMDAAALAIVSRGAHAVFIKGGHLAETPIDVLWDGEHLRHYEAPRIVGDMRGTGCALAMSIAAALAHGHSLRNAIRAGREIVRHLLPLARPLGALRVVP